MSKEKYGIETIESWIAGEDKYFCPEVMLAASRLPSPVPSDVVLRVLRRIREEENSDVAWTVWSKVFFAISQKDFDATPEIIEELKHLKDVACGFLDGTYPFEYKNSWLSNAYFSWELIDYLHKIV